MSKNQSINFLINFFIKISKLFSNLLTDFWKKEFYLDKCLLRKTVARMINKHLLFFLYFKTTSELEIIQQCLYINDLIDTYAKEELNLIFSDIAF